MVQRENYDKNAKHSTAITAYKLFVGRDHYTCGEDGWQAVADRALEWARSARGRANSSMPEAVPENLNGAVALNGRARPSRASRRPAPEEPRDV